MLLAGLLWGVGGGIGGQPGAGGQRPELSPAAGKMGPLRVHPENPRYFQNTATGQVVYLTGSHVWYNLLDMGPEDPPQPFRYERYLDWLGSLNHNFIRLWTWELSTWNTEGNAPQHRNERTFHFVFPLPWARTGPGLALDGKPRFDLERFDESYFQRLRSRVEAARRRGCYVSVMLFEGWGIQHVPDGWRSHPFHLPNNVNGIEADLDGDGKGLELHTLADPRLTALQESYVGKVVDTLAGLDNLLWEIANESHPGSTEWQYHMIRFLREYSRARGIFPHPVGMTFQYRGGSNQTLWDSPADWVSPNPQGGFRDDPPVNEGTKVVFNDTDHLWGIGGNAPWVWQSFLRGHQPIFMDPYDGLVLGQEFDPRWGPVRCALGRTREFAVQVNLARMSPQPELASSRYCLADPGREYLIYVPWEGRVLVNLSQADGEFDVQWLDPESGRRFPGEPVRGGQLRQLSAPFEAGEAVVYLKVHR